MTIVNIEGGQGSPAWLAYRNQPGRRNASDAPSMFGCNPHETRTELLHRLYTGLHKEFDRYKQEHVIDAGHSAEALARPHAERALGCDLYPVIHENATHSASLDGQNDLGDTDWEHKALNAELRACMPKEGIGDAEVGRKLPLRYRVQVAHQQHCSGAERTLFTASEWDGDRLIEMRHCWIERDEELIAEVLAGWAQFDADLAAYVPRDIPEKAQAAVMEVLPTVWVKVKGELTTESNLADLQPLLAEWISRLPKEPTTDTDFATLEAAGKRLGDLEDALKACEAQALGSVEGLEKVRVALIQMKDLCRATRLASEKIVDKQKIKLREDAIAERRNALGAHVTALHKKLDGMMPAVPDNFAGVIKSLKTLASLHDKLDTELARCKIEADRIAARIEVNRAKLLAAGDKAAFPDAKALVLKEPEDLDAIIAQRVAETEKRLEAMRRAEEDAAARRALDGAAQLAQQPETRELGAALSSVVAAAVADDAIERAARPTAPAAPARRLGDTLDQLGWHMTQAEVTALGVTTLKPTGKGAAVMIDEAQWVLLGRLLRERVALVFGQ